MKIISNAECEEWLISHNISYSAPNRDGGLEGDIALPVDGYGYVFEVPSDSHTTLFLAHYLAGWLEGKDVLLWMTSWPLYDAQQRALLNQFRQCFGETRRLIDAPGYTADMTKSKDVWDVGQLLQLMMIFDWQGYVIESTGSIIWMADGFIEISTQRPEKQLQIQTIHEDNYLNLKVTRSYDL